VDQLERLERETGRATEAAFYLARNAAVTRFLLDEAHAPQVPAVAIALDHPSDGPFLVTTREGAPLACLRRGTRPREAIVTRTQLEAAAQRHEHVRIEVGRWGDAVDHARPGFRALFRTLLEAGDALPKETLDALAPFLPLVFDRLPGLWYACDDVLRDFVKRGAERLVEARDRLEPRQKEQVRRTWRLHWAVGHLQALFAQADDDSLRHAAGGIIQGAAPIRATRLGFWPVALRGLALCGRLGPTLLTGLEHGLKAPPETVHEALTAAHGLGFLGAAHPRYRHEIAARLSETFESLDARTSWLAREQLLIAEALNDLVINSDEAEKALFASLEALRARGVELPPMPEGTSLVTLANLPLPLHGRVALVFLRHGLGAFARTPILDLYPSAAALAARPAPSDPLAAGLELFEIAVEHLNRVRRGDPSAR
jgi:hypothetical protein